MEKHVLSAVEMIFAHIWNSHRRKDQRKSFAHLFGIKGKAN